MNGLFFVGSAGIVLSETLKGHRPGPLGIRSTLQALNFGDAGMRSEHRQNKEQHKNGSWKDNLRFTASSQAGRPAKLVPRVMWANTFL